MKKYLIVFLFLSLLCLNSYADEDNSEYVAFIYTGMSNQNYNWMIETNSTKFLKDFFQDETAWLLKYVTKYENGIYKFTKVGVNVLGDPIEIKGVKANFDYVLSKAAKMVKTIYISYDYVKTYCVSTERILEHTITTYEGIYRKTGSTNYALTIYSYKYADLYEKCNFFEDYSDMPDKILDEYFLEKEKEAENNRKKHKKTEDIEEKVDIEDTEEQ